MIKLICDGPAADPIFRGLRDSPLFELDCEHLERMWGRYAKLADPHFAREIRDNFIARYWEMFVACSMMDGGKTVESKPKGPDLIVKGDGGGVEAYVEAVAPGGGTGPDAVPDDAGWVPQDGLVLRYRSAIEDKYRKYLSYLDSEVVEDGTPLVIALNPRRMALALAPTDPPRIVQAVFGIGRTRILFDRQTMEVRQSGYQHAPSKTKASGAEVSTEIFLDPAYSALSAVIYACVPGASIHASSAADLTVVHNHLAANPLPRGWLSVGHEIAFDGKAVRRWSHEGT